MCVELKNLLGYLLLVAADAAGHVVALTSSDSNELRGANDTEMVATLQDGVPFLRLALADGTDIDLGDASQVLQIFERSFEAYEFSLSGNLLHLKVFERFVHLVVEDLLDGLFAAGLIQVFHGDDLEARSAHVQLVEGRRRVVDFDPIFGVMLELVLEGFQVG